MVDLSQVNEHADVVGSDGQHVGTVDKVEGNQIKLTKKDLASGGQHHLIPNEWIERIAGNTLYLNKSSQEAKQSWRGEAGDADDALTQDGGAIAGESSTASGGANNETGGASAGSSFSGTASGGARDLDV